MKLQIQTTLASLAALIVLSLLHPLQAGAQSIVDAANQERARQNQITGIRSFTNEDLRRPVASAAAVAATQAAESVAESEAESGAETAPAAPIVAASAPVAIAQEISVIPAVDPVQVWNQQVQSTRAKVRDLQDQEVALQLQINDLTNQFFAPVTSVSVRNEVQARLTAAQSRLTAVQTELVQTRIALQQLEATGP